MNIKELQQEAHTISRAHGWYDGNDERNIPEMLVLVHSEVSEALEDYRRNDMAMRFNIGPGPSNSKPEGFPFELADIIIRVGDLAEYLGIDLEEAIRVKMDFNRTRPYRHGNKKA